MIPFISNININNNFSSNSNNNSNYNNNKTNAYLNNNDRKVSHWMFLVITLIISAYPLIHHLHKNISISNSNNNNISK